MFGGCRIALEYLDNVILDPITKDAVQRVTNGAAYVFKKNVDERCRIIKWTEPYRAPGNVYFHAGGGKLTYRGTISDISPQLD